MKELITKFDQSPMILVLLVNCPMKYTFFYLLKVVPIKYCTVTLSFTNDIK